MIVLDAYALIALLADEPAAGEVERLIAGTCTTVPAPNLAEAADRLGRVHGIPVEPTRSAVESLQQTTDLHVRALEAKEAWRAAELRVAHYHRTRCPLSLWPTACCSPSRQSTISWLRLTATCWLRPAPSGSGGSNFLTRRVSATRQRKCELGLDDHA